MRNITRPLAFLAVLLAYALAPWGSVAGAQVSEAIADTIDAEGYYADPGSGDQLDASDYAAIEGANQSCVGFAYFDRESGGDEAGGQTAIRLAEQTDDYTSVVVLYQDGVYGAGDSSLINVVGNEGVVSAFASGEIDTGLDLITSSIGTSGACSGAAAASAPTASPTSAGSAGSGIPWLLILILAAGVFMIVRWFRAKRKTTERIATDLEEDRQEIRDELADTADLVISLGDPVIASGDQELISSYEDASRTYTDVSRSLEGAKTTAEIDELDRRLDLAAWKLDVIDAKLKGESIPEPPPPDGTPHIPERGERPALSQDDSIFDTTGASRRQAGRRAPRQPSRRNGGLGGMNGGGMGRSVLTSILMMLFNGYSGRTNRTHRRDTSRRGPSGGFGGLGGGVLRPHRGGGPGTYGGGRFGRRYGGGSF